MADDSHVFLNNGISSNMIPVQPAEAAPVIEVPQLSLIEQFQAAEAAKRAKASVNDPYALTPSIVPPTGQQAQLEAQAAQGSYPAFQAGGPEDIQNLISKNSALTQAQAPAQESQNASMETVAADPAQFVAPKTQESVSVKPTAESGVIADLERSYGMQQRGIEAAADAGAKKAVEEAAYREKMDSDFAAQALKTQTAAKEVQDAVDLQMKDLENLRTEMAAVSKEKVDPQGLWNNASTGSKIMAGISMALGGLGGAYTGKGDNKALEIINRAIDKDIDAQKFNIGLKSQNIKDKAGITNNILSSLNQKFNNTMQAEQAARFLMLEQAKNKLEQVAAKYQGPELQAKAQVLIGQLNAEAAKSLYTVKATAQEKELQKRLMEKAYGQPGQMKPVEVALMPKDFQERYVPGYGAATNKTAAEDFQKYRAEVGPALDNGREVLKLGKDIKGFKQLNPVKRAEVESRLAILAGQLRLPITGPGALTDDEYQRLRTTVGDPKKIMGLNQIELKKLETVIKWLDNSLKSRAEQSGLAMPQTEDYNKSLGFKPSN